MEYLEYRNAIQALGKLVCFDKYNTQFEYYGYRWDGDYYPMGRDGDEGACNPKMEWREEAIRVCCMAYEELRPYIADIVQLNSAYPHSPDSELWGAIGFIREYETKIRHIVELRRRLKVGEILTPLHEHPGTSSPGKLQLPPELDTERARKYFARAMEIGWINRTSTGYEWTYGGQRGRLVRLGYFVEKVYCPANSGQLPEKALNRLFGVERISSVITQMHSAKRTQQWKTEIDNKIFYD